MIKAISTAKGEAIKYQAYYRWLRRVMNQATTPEMCEQIIEERMNQREEQLLTLIRNYIYSYPPSPYLKLLNNAGYDFAKIERLVDNEGVENTLLQLSNDGVYFTLDEFKGDKDVNRNGVKFRCTESMFDNPEPNPGFRVKSGGSRSAGTTTFLQFAYASETIPYFALMMAEHDCADVPTGLWFPTLPAVSGFFKLMRLAFIGNPPKKWFTQVKSNQSDSLKSKAAISVAMLVGRKKSLQLPFPEFVSVNNAGKIVEWLVKTRDAEKRCVLYTYPSSAVRVANAAIKHGHSLEGVHFFVVGEPLTMAKKEAIEASDARVVNFYGFTELGIVGSACSEEHPSRGHDDIHVFTDALGVIQKKRQFGEQGAVVESLLFTSLLTDVAPKILLNVESGDYGIISRQNCQCAFDKFGWKQHLCRIESFSKLSGEGATFVGTDLVRILDEVLPERFGGVPSDYQVVEQEDQHGLTKLCLVVNPSLGYIDEQEVRQLVLEALSKEGPRGEVSSSLWNTTNAIKVQRSNPAVTPVGKILSYHLVKNPSDN